MGNMMQIMAYHFKKCYTVVRNDINKKVYNTTRDIFTYNKSKPEVAYYGHSFINKAYKKDFRHIDILSSSLYLPMSQVLFNEYEFLSHNLIKYL